MQPEPDPSPVEQPRKSKKRKLPKIVSQDEALSLLRAAELDGYVSGRERKRNRLMLEFMYRAGLRVSEVCAVGVRDVEREGVIHLYDAKGGDGTAYFDTESLMPQLDHWLKIREAWQAPAGAPLFIRPDGKPVSVRYVQRLVKRLKEQLGITGILTPHVLRHTFATELIEEGFPIHEVQAALRHANLATTEVYLHVRNEDLRRKISGRARKGEA